MVEHQPRLLSVPGSIPGWGACDFSVSAEASNPISLYPFLSSTFLFPSSIDLSFALKIAPSHLSRYWVPATAKYFLTCLKAEKKHKICELIF